MQKLKQGLGHTDMVETEQEAGIKRGDLQERDDVVFPFVETGSCLRVYPQDTEFLQVADCLVSLFEGEDRDDSSLELLNLHLGDFLFRDFRMCECLYHACSSSSIGCISSSPLKRTACNALRALSSRPPQ